MITRARHRLSQIPTRLLRTILLMGIGIGASVYAARPLVFELDLDQAKQIQVAGSDGLVERSVRLLAVREFFWSPIISTTITGGRISAPSPTGSRRWPAWEAW